MKSIFTLFILISIMAFKVFHKNELVENAAPQKTTIAPPPTDCNTPTNTTENVVCKAQALKALLTTSQINTLQVALTTANSVKWSNLPCGSSCRNGIQFSTLTTAQLAAANEVIKAAAGSAADEGYDEFSQIVKTDGYLGTAGGGSGYSSGIYFIAFLGEPSLTGKWQLQFGGHHYAGNITYNNGHVAGTSPTFEGVEPTSWTDSNGTVVTPLGQEKTAMAAMFASLNSTQLASAKTTSTFSDVALGPNKDGQFPTTKIGLQCNQLDATQKALVLAAMQKWVGDADDASGASLMQIYTNELDQTYIAWSGNSAFTSNANYGRIDGPSVWIEFVCQNGVVFSGIHYHSVYRDHYRDYGASGTLATDEIGSEAELHFQLGSNFPNPFSTMTTIPFSLAAASTVEVEVYDLTGRRLFSLEKQKMEAGKQALVLDENSFKNGISAGLYFYKMTVENGQGRFSQTRKLTFF